MELELDKEEVKLALMNWVEIKWPGVFKQVELEDRYSSKGATFSSKLPEAGDE